MTMEYRNIGNTDLKLSAITFGSWAAGSWMWGKTDRNDAISAIRAAYDLAVHPASNAYTVFLSQNLEAKSWKYPANIS